MATRRWILFSVVLVTQALCAAAGEAAPNSEAKALAERLSKGFKWRACVAVNGTSVARNHGFNDDEYMRSQFSQFTSDDRQEWQHEIAIVSSADNRTLRLDFTRQFFGDKLRISLEQDRLESSPPGAAVYTGDKVTSSSTRRAKRQCVESLNCGSFMQGYIQGMQGNDLPALLADASHLEILKGSSDVGGTPCQVLRAETQFGQIDLWIPEGDTSMPLKMTITREQGHLYNEETMGDIGVQAWSAEIVFDEMSVFGDYQVPMYGHYSQFVTTTDGRKTSVDCEVHFTSVDINPDFEALGAFSTTFPDGTRLVDASFPALKYVIRDGERIPFMDIGLPEDIMQAVSDFEVTRDSVSSSVPQEASAGIRSPRPDGAAPLHVQVGYALLVLRAVALIPIALLFARGRRRGQTGIENQSEEN